MKKKLFAIVCALFAMQMAVWAQVASGSCGESVTWALNERWTDDDGTQLYQLVISGTGKMENYGGWNGDRDNDYSLGDRPWDEYADKIESIIIEDGVTSIGNFAFAFLRRLQYAVYDELDYIGDGAFAFSTVNLDVLRAKEIGYRAFMYCGLDSFVVESSAIGPEAFRKTNVERVVICSEHVGAGAFSECLELWEVTFEGNVKEIRDRAFSGCEDLKAVNMYVPAPPTLGEDVFAGIHPEAKLVFDSYIAEDFDVMYAYDSSDWGKYFEISVPPIASGFCGDPNVNNGEDVKWELSADSVLTISGVGAMEDYGYMNNHGWTVYSPWRGYPVASVVVKEGVANVGDGAFLECVKMESIELPSSCTVIGDSAFYACSSLKSIVIPEGVNSIGNRAFRGCVSLKSVNIPENVTFVDEATFFGCISLTSIVIPNSVTSIGNEAFGACFGLTSITLPNSVTSIGDWAFASCDGLSDITIPNSVTSIGDGAFEDCRSLTSITIPNSVTFIGTRTFGGCTSLTSITIPNSVTSIGNEAFSYCTDLTGIAIPNSVTSIGDKAFYDCRSLTSIAVPNSVTSIGNEAFYDCRSLTSIAIPNSVTSIGDWAFVGCSSLESIVVDEGNPSYDSRGNCNAIVETATNTLISGCRNTTIPNSVTSIGELAFAYCDGLKSVVIPNSVTSIGINAFAFCLGLRSITIPNSVTSIEGGAFRACSFLSAVTCLNPVPPTLVEFELIEESIFKGISADATLYVPDVEAYKASDWAQYFSKIELIDPETISGVKADKDAPATIYDLSGRRVAMPVEGRIYVVNGKTVVW